VKHKGLIGYVFEFSDHAAGRGSNRSNDSVGALGLAAGMATSTYHDETAVGGKFLWYRED
jgi:hypothetical protein